jgi:UDP-2,3-diacylglucosamine pyrophosphatase LpxH
MSKSLIFEHLTEHLLSMPATKLSKRDRLVVFSDLHMGNGTRKDDFLKNAPLFFEVLKDYYLLGGYKLILNGDVEELQKFSLGSILQHWNEIYDLLGDFHKKNRLYRILGNHDYSLHLHRDADFKGELHHGLKMDYKGNTLFVFHGHQASMFYENYNDVSGFFLRHVVHPLGIKNRSPAYDSRKRYNIERKVYQFSTRHKIMSIIGHTHRPLFESLSRVDFLRYKIEQLCRAYTEAGRKEKARLENDIQYYKEEMKRVRRKERWAALRSSLYDATVIVPCMFNSGTVIGKRGMTCVEITGGKISLVHWFDQNQSEKYFSHYERNPERLGRTRYYRITLKEEHLDYIFTRIKLLS